MKAIVFARENEVAVVEKTCREVEPEDVKVKMAFCAICATDVHIVTEGLYGIPADGSWILGHESSGTIVEVGEKAAEQGLKVGDRVTMNPIVSCGDCYYCHNGQEHYCENSWKWSFKNNGCMTEYVVFHKSQVYPIPDTVSLEEAALAEPLSVCMRAMDLAQIKIGNRVIVSGAGGIGLILLQLAKLQGGTKLTVIEPVEEKRKLALKLGAEYVIDPKTQDITAEAMRITENRGYDCVIEASGVPVAAPPCLQIVAKCGKIVYFAVFPKDYELPVNLQKLYDQEASILTVFAYPYLYPRGVAALKAIDLKSIIGATFDLTDAVAAFEAHKKSIYPKILIKCS